MESLIIYGQREMQDHYQFFRFIPRSKEIFSNYTYFYVDSNQQVICVA